MKNLRVWVLAFGALLVALATMAVAQATYQPKPGETVLRAEIEGRGSLYILLHTKEAPKTTEHILKLVRQSFYDGQRFHRAERSPKPYLVQVGDPASKRGELNEQSLGGSGTSIPFENSGKPNVLGAVGLARNPREKDSGDSQFYILLAPKPFLDGNYTVFGQVVAGMDVLQRIEKGDRITRISVL